MPREDNVYVANFHYAEPDDSNYAHAEVIEVGGRGDLVRLHQVVYHYYDIVAGTLAQIIADALSENPEHEYAPPAGIEDFAASPALYGRNIWTKQASQITAEGYFDTQWWNQAVKLYGIIRPRRQIWVTYAVQGTPALGKRSMELYYSIVRLSREEQDSINTRSGKYRRS